MPSKSKIIWSPPIAGWRYPLTQVGSLDGVYEYIDIENQFYIVYTIDTYYGKKSILT